MKTQLIALVLLLASSPAVASIDTSEAMPIDIAPQPAVFPAEPVATPDPACGQPRQMIFILRDPSGSIVAMGVADVTPSC